MLTRAMARITGVDINNNFLTNSLNYKRHAVTCFLNYMVEIIHYMISILFNFILIFRFGFII